MLKKKRLLTCRVSLQACVPSAVLPCWLNMCGGNRLRSPVYHVQQQFLAAWVNPPAYFAQFRKVWDSKV